MYLISIYWNGCRDGKSQTHPRIGRSGDGCRRGLANLELREDLRDIAAQNAARIGLAPPSTDEYLRSTVVRAAREHEIRLEPEQVILNRTGTAEAPILYLAADYNVRVKLPGYSFTLHFTPSSAR